MRSDICTEIDEDGIAVVTWGAAGAPACINADSIEALAGVVDRVATDDTIRGVILMGGGLRFGDGLDLPWLADATSRSGRDLLPAIVRLNALVQRIEVSSKPWIAAINGSAWGASLEVALACHTRLAVAGADVRLGLLDAKLGLPPAAGGALRLARLVGTAKAQALLFAAQPMSPAQALKAGLVDENVAAEDLLSAAKVRAARPVQQRSTCPLETLPTVPSDGHQPVRAAIVDALNDDVAMAPTATQEAAARLFVEIASGNVRAPWCARWA